MTEAIGSRFLRGGARAVSGSASQPAGMALAAARSPFTPPLASPLRESHAVPHFDASTAECLVLTYKEGILAAVAHDLEIRVERFDLDIDDATLAVRAGFDAGSLKVIRTIFNGALGFPAANSTVPSGCAHVWISRLMATSW